MTKAQRFLATARKVLRYTSGQKASYNTLVKKSAKQDSEIEQMNVESEKQRLLQRKFLEHMLRDLPITDMIEVYSQTPRGNSSCGVFCALVPDTEVANCLTKLSWDFSIGDGTPGAMQYYEDGESHTEYLRFGDDDGIEPLVLHRSFHGVREPYLELCEEFRTFHNLYHDTKNNRFYRFDDSGNEILVASIEQDLVNVRLLEIRQFLAVRAMHLAIYFDSVQKSDITLEKLGLTEREELGVHDADSSYALNFGDYRSFSAHESFSRLFGKRFVPPLPKEKSGCWGFEEELTKTFVDYIIGVDAGGNEILHTSDESKLSNYFGANPGEPHYLTPVFFRKTVLDKYYQQSGKYSIEAGNLSCAGLWSIRMDNHQDDVVSAWLGDLGRDLPHQEALHWRSHNIPPAKMSETFFRQQILGQWVSTDHPEHVFKHVYRQLATESQKRLGWQVLLPLTDEDHHFLQSLRIPATNEQKDFDEVILGLTKVLIDSLNEKQLNAFIPPADLATIRGSISRLEKSWEHLQVVGYSDHIRFLRDLQDLRSSGAAHRKGSNYKKIAEKLGIEAGNLRQVFRGMLEQGLRFLEFVEQNLDSLRLTPPIK